MMQNMFTIKTSVREVNIQMVLFDWNQETFGLCGPPETSCLASLFGKPSMVEVQPIQSNLGERKRF